MGRDARGDRRDGAAGAARAGSARPVADPVDAAGALPSRPLYESTTWDEPPLTYGLDVTLAKGSGFRFACEYRWQPPDVGCGPLDASDPAQPKCCCYASGSNPSVNEDCLAVVYYCPKQPDANAHCE